MLTELFVCQALLLEGLSGRHAVAELSADLLLDQFVHDTLRQVVAGGFELVQDQLSIEQLFKLGAAKFAQLALEELGPVAELLAESLGAQLDRQLDFVQSDNRVMNDGANAVGRVGAQLEQRTGQQDRA